MSNLILGRDVLNDWKIYPLDIDGAITRGWPHSDSQKSFPAPQKEPSVGPVFYMGTLQPNGLAWDTFLKLNEWTKVKLIFLGGGYFGTNTLHSFVGLPHDSRDKIIVSFPMLSLLLFFFNISGSGLDQWYEPGTILASQRPSTDPLHPWTPAQPNPSQQHHSAGAGGGTSTPTGSFHGPASVQCPW